MQAHSTAINVQVVFLLMRICLLSVAVVVDAQRWTFLKLMGLSKMTEVSHDHTEVVSFRLTKLAEIHSGCLLTGCGWTTPCRKN